MISCEIMAHMISEGEEVTYLQLLIQNSIEITIRLKRLSSAGIENRLNGKVKGWEVNTEPPRLSLYRAEKEMSEGTTRKRKAIRTENATF